MKSTVVFDFDHHYETDLKFRDVLYGDFVDNLFELKKIFNEPIIIFIPFITLFEMGRAFKCEPVRFAGGFPFYLNSELLF